MFKTLLPDWQLLPPRHPGFVSENRQSPYNGEAILVCHRNKLFEARWMTNDKPDFDQVYAQENHLSGYWLGPVHLVTANLINPGGLSPTTTGYSTYWTPIPEPYLTGRKAAVASRIVEGGMRDRAVVICAPGMVGASYKPDRDEWLDVLGRTTHRFIPSGLVVKLPSEKVSERVSEQVSVTGRNDYLWL